MSGPFTDLIREKFGVELPHTGPQSMEIGWEMRTIDKKLWLCRVGTPDPVPEEPPDVRSSVPPVEEPSILPEMDETTATYVEDINDGITRAQVEDYIRMDHRIPPERAVLHKFNQLIDKKWKDTIRAYVSFQERYPSSIKRRGTVPYGCSFTGDENIFSGRCILPTKIQLSLSGNGRCGYAS